MTPETIYRKLNKYGNITFSLSYSYYQKVFDDLIAPDIMKSSRSPWFGKHFSHNRKRSLDFVNELLFLENRIILIHIRFLDFHENKPEVGYIAFTKEVKDLKEMFSVLNVESSKTELDSI